MVGLDEVIARVQIAVVLERNGVAARLVEDAERRRYPEPRRERGIEVRHEHLPHVAPHPLVEDRAQELSPGIGLDGSIGDRVALLETRVVHPFDDRDQLDVLYVQLVAKEPIDVEGVVVVRRVHGAQHVHLDTVAPEQVEASHHLLEGGLTLLVDPVRVVQPARARRC